MRDTEEEEALGLLCNEMPQKHTLLLVPRERKKTLSEEIASLKLQKQALSASTINMPCKHG